MPSIFIATVYPFSLVSLYNHGIILSACYSNMLERAHTCPFLGPLLIVDVFTDTFRNVPVIHLEPQKTWIISPSLMKFRYGDDKRVTEKDTLCKDESS